jgi:hypothetical protein
MGALEPWVFGAQAGGVVTAAAVMLLFGRTTVQAIRRRSPTWRLALSVLLAWAGAAVVFGRTVFLRVLEPGAQTEHVWRLCFLVLFLTSGALAVSERWQGRVGWAAFCAWSITVAAIMASLALWDAGRMAP